VEVWVWEEATPQSKVGLGPDWIFSLVEIGSFCSMGVDGL
jgi:hypothetical protein